MIPQTHSEDQHLQNFLQRKLARFDSITGPTQKIEHRLRLRDSRSNQRYRPRNPAMQAIINEAVDEMLRDGIIEPSKSA